MTPAEIAKLPTPRTDWLYEPRQAALGHIVFNPHVTLEASYTYSRTLEQQLAAAVMALESARNGYIDCNDDGPMGREMAKHVVAIDKTLAAIKEMG